MLDDVTSVSVSVSGSVTMAAVTRNGGLYCWGCNGDGQVGNGTTAAQTRPVKVLDDVTSVSVSGSGFAFGSVTMAAVTRNGDLYCWGYNGYGQVGDGTTEDRTTPVRIMNLTDGDPTPTPGDDPDPTGDNIAKFTLPATEKVSLGKGSVSFSGKITLKAGEALSADQWEQIADSITWTSSDQAYTGEIRCTPVLDSSKDANDLLLLIYMDPTTTGSATITGTLPNGMTQSCLVTVGPRKDYNGSTKRHITGTLRSVGNFTVVIDGTEYGVGPDFDLSKAQQILLGDCQTVVAELSDNDIMQMDRVKDVVRPYISIVPGSSNLTYKKGSFKKGLLDSSVLKLEAEIYCEVRSPYYRSDVTGTEAEDVGVQFTGYTLEVPADSPLSFQGGQKTATSILDLNMKLGDETQKVEIPMYIDGEYVPPEVNVTLPLEATVSSRFGQQKRNESIQIFNQDLQDALYRAAQEENVQKKEVEKVQDQLGDIQLAVGEDLLAAYYSPRTIREIKGIVSAWISSICATMELREDESFLKKLQKDLGLTKDDIIKNIVKKTLKELGVQLPNLTTADIDIKSIKNATVMIEMISDTGEERGKTLKVYFNLENMDFYALNNDPSFGAFGNLSYYIIDSKGHKKVSDLAKAAVTYTEVKSLVDGMKKIGMSSIEKVYKEVFGNKMDKLASTLRIQINSSATNFFVKVLTSALMEKILKKYGITFSNVVFKKGKSELEELYSRYEFHCPVDIYVYDESGELCGSIVDDEIVEDKNKIGMFVAGDSKYVYLPNEQYIIKYVGNDTGNMRLKMATYADDQEVRAIEYKEIPLSEGKTYYSIVPDTIYMDNTVISPMSAETGSTILPDSDSWQDENVPTQPDISPAPGGDEKPTPFPRPVKKTAQTLRLKYGTTLKRTVGARLTQQVSGAHTRVTFTSSDPKVAKIDKNNGKITCVGVGTTIITAKAAASGRYKAASKQVTLQVIPKNVEIRSLTPRKKGKVVIKISSKADDTRYQIQYKYRGSRGYTTVGTKNTRVTLKGLRSGKVLMVRVRAYKKVKGKTYYSGFSLFRNVMIK